MNKYTGHYYQPERFPLFSFRVFLLAGFLTLCIFLLLPFSELLVRTDHKYLIRDIKTIEVAKSAPVPPRIREIKKSKATKPRLTTVARELPPLEIAAGLALEVDPGFGDFSLAFNLTPVLEEGSLVFELDEVDTPPQPLVQIPPIYPISAKLAGVEGTVLLHFTVQIDGTVDSVEVISARPEHVFDEAAKSAVSKWRFKPGIKNGKPVATRVSIPLRFELEKRR